MEQHRGSPTSAALHQVSISAQQIVSDRVSTPAGWAITRAVVRSKRVHPSHLTLVGLFVGLISAGLLSVAFERGSLALQIAAVLGWQVAYAFDCADGQLARLTGRSSRPGGELDICCDVFVQIALVVAVGVVAAEHSSVHPAVPLAFATTWGVTHVATLMARLRHTSWDSEALRASSPLVWISRQLRDYALAVFVVALAAAFSPQRMLPWAMGCFIVINGGALCAYVATRFLASVRSTST